MDDNDSQEEMDTYDPMPMSHIKNIFFLHFDIPFGAATRDLEIKSDVRYAEFLVDLADAMGVKVSTLRVGYIFSFLPKSPKPKPKLLDSEKCWKTLICDLATWIESEKCKNKGKGMVCPWSIRIENLNEDKGSTQSKVS